MFNVGDRVVVVGETMFCHDRGEVVNLREDSEFSVRVKLDDDCVRSFMPSELVLEADYDVLSAKPVEEPLYVEAKVDSRDESVEKFLEMAKTFSPEEDMVSHPSHYTSHPSGVECIQIVQHYNFPIGSAMKYLWRAGLKDEDTEIQDLQKAIQFIQFEIERLGGTT